MEIPKISSLLVEVSNIRTETGKDDIKIFSDGRKKKMIAWGWINNRYNMCSVFLNKGFESLDDSGEYVTELQNAIEERELKMEY